MPKSFIVLNSAGLNVRSKPDTATGQVFRKMTMGEGFVAQDVFIVRDEVWARLSEGNSVHQQYCMIRKTGRPDYAREVGEVAVQPVPPVSGDPWRNAIDAWARLKGFDGPLP